jgi:hypothetical protein
MEEELLIPSRVEGMPDDTRTKDLFGERDHYEWVHVKAGAGHCKQESTPEANNDESKRTVLQLRQVSRALYLEHHDPDYIVRVGSRKVVVYLFA